MKIAVSDVREAMRKALLTKGYEGDDLDFIIDVYLGGELRGHITHGLAPFPAFIRHDFSDCEEPVVLKHTHSLFMIDAKKNAGIVVGRHAAEEAMKLAREEAVGMAIIKNMADWVRPGAIAQYIAECNMIAIVTNDGSGRAIAPPGGYDPTLGTNPIAYGFPTANDPIVVEMATAKRAWGQVRLANKFNRDVPTDSYYTNEGKVAVHPSDVHSAMPFGEYKGFSLALLVEVMNGSMIGDGMMVVADANNFNNSWPPNSGSILVIDPSQTSDLETFKKETTQAIEFIKSTQPLPGQEIRIPGENAGKRQAQALNDDTIEIADEIWEEISSL